MSSIGGKRKNHRKYPGMKHRADFAQTRQTEAKERQAAYDQLTVQQKLDRLPPNGAKKQRARLTAQLTPTKQESVA
jgi:hypothetical protein